MALTDSQKSQIRRYLGYPDLFRYRNTRLEGALDGNLSATAEALVVADLATLASIDAAMSASGLGSAGVKRVDEIEFFGSGQTITSIANIGRMAIGRISTTFGVPPMADYYGSRGWPGDTYSVLGGLGENNSGGGAIPLG